MAQNMTRYLIDRIKGIARIFRFPKVDLRRLTKRQKTKLRHALVWGSLYGALGALAIGVIYGHIIPVIMCAAWIEFVLIVNLTDPALKE